jgi:hypothetical protein
MTPDARPAPRCPTLYRDRDGDGHGAPGASVTSCAAVIGWAASSDDCDGDNPEVPLGYEECDGIDNNCSDGTRDEACPLGCTPDVDPRTGEAYLFCDGAGAGWSWGTAKRICADTKFGLARIDDDAENAYISRTAGRLFGDGREYWLGGSDQDSEDKWTWLDGSPLSYHPWATSQPDDGASSPPENCLTQLGSDNELVGSWNDAFCERQFSFVCEREQRVKR